MGLHDVKVRLLHEGDEAAAILEIPCGCRRDVHADLHDVAPPIASPSALGRRRVVRSLTASRSLSMAGWNAK